MPDQFEPIVEAIIIGSMILLIVSVPIMKIGLAIYDYYHERRRK